MHYFTCNFLKSNSIVEGHGSLLQPPLALLLTVGCSDKNLLLVGVYVHKEDILGLPEHNFYWQ